MDCVTKPRAATVNVEIRVSCLNMKPYVCVRPSVENVRESGCMIVFLLKDWGVEGGIVYPRA